MGSGEPGGGLFLHAAIATVATVVRAKAMSRSVLVNDRPDILALQRPRDHSMLEPVDDLKLVARSRARQVLDDHTLDGQIVQVACEQLAGADARDVARRLVLLRVVLEQARLVLDE